MQKKYISIIFLLIICFITEIYGKDYKGAEYRTKASFLYGRFEARFKPANREGVVSSFFTYAEISNLSEWNEIDYEFLGRYENHVQVNVISPNQINHENNRYLDFNPYADFHTYAFEWTPDYIAWFVDGIEISRQTGSHIQQINRAQKIMMNIWPPAYEGWVGVLDPSGLPARSYYDWVSYSTYTPGSGSTGSGNNFTPSWNDDFNTFDQNRWAKASHTWQGNNSDFILENAVITDGMLILCLTDNVNIGNVDLTKPAVSYVRENYDNTVKVVFNEEVDKNSAESIANYIIPGVQITGAALQPEGRSVIISTQNYQQSVPYNIIVQNIKDDAIPANTITLSAKTIAQNSEITFPLKINVGGSASGDYSEDLEWTYAAPYGYINGSSTIYPSNLIISGTTEPVIFREERWGVVSYRVKIPNGNYDVSLLFAENYFNVAGARKFNILLNGELFADSLDVFAQAGANAAYTITKSITVQDELLDFYFDDIVDHSFLNGIIVDGEPTDLGIRENKDNPSSFGLEQNYPNPFNAGTKIIYSLDRQSDTTLRIYDALGSELLTENFTSLPAGEHSYYWDGRNDTGSILPSGVYFYQLTNGQSSKIKKMLFIK